MLRRTIRPRALAAEKTSTSQMRAGLVNRSSRLGRRVPVALERRATTTAIAPAKMLVQICESVRCSGMAVAPRRYPRSHHLVQHRRLGSEWIRGRRVFAEDTLLSGRDKSIEEKVSHEEEGARERVEKALVLLTSRGGMRRVARRLREEVGCASVRHTRSVIGRSNFILRCGRPTTHPRRITPPAIHSFVLCCFFQTRAPTTSTGIILLVLAVDAQGSRSQCLRRHSQHGALG